MNEISDESMNQAVYQHKKDVVYLAKQVLTFYNYVVIEQEKYIELRQNDRKYQYLKRLFNG